MSTLVALFLRLVVLAILTFGFVVLFEHGVDGFKAGIPVEAAALRSFLEGKAPTKADEVPPPTVEPSSPAATPESTPVTAVPIQQAATPSPSPTPAPNEAVSSWQRLQTAPIDSGANQSVGEKDKPVN